jgi:hypothetical protein
MAEDPAAVMLAEARADVGLADHKASMVLAVLGIGFGALLGGLIAGDWSPSDLKGLGEPIWWLGAGMAAASVVCAAMAVWPRFTSADYTEGIFYWGHVAQFETLWEFSDALNSQKPVEDRTKHQLWRISKIVVRKYQLIRIAFVLAGGAGVALLLGATLG